MREMFGRDRCMRIPLDGRLGVALIWLSAVVLAGADWLDDGRLGFKSVLALMISQVAAVITVALLHAHSRRVVLEVMSWEHRQLANSDGNSPLQSISRFPRD